MTYLQQRLVNTNTELQEASQESESQLVFFGEDLGGIILKQVCHKRRSFATETVPYLS
jgi:hypothetical protein